MHLPKYIINVTTISLILLISGCQFNNSQTETLSTTNNMSKTTLTTGNTTNTPNSKKSVNKGDNIEVDYIGRLENGEVFDTSIEKVAKEKNLYNANRKYSPLPFTVGAGQMIAGFDNGVIGMLPNETKTVTINPEDAYGNINPDNIKELSGDVFSGSGIKPEIGKSVNFGYAMGKILEINGNKLKVDFNDPLAGKKLIFDITVISIK